MKDLYIQMCKGSPVQKKWKPNFGDTYVWNDLFMTVLDGYKRDDSCVWIPTTEDWMRVYVNSSKPMNLRDASYYILSLLPYGVVKELCDWNIDTIRVCWCLLVNLEVYGLEWDWESSKWVSA